MLGNDVVLPMAAFGGFPMENINFKGPSVSSSYQTCLSGTDLAYRNNSACCWYRWRLLNCKVIPEGSLDTDFRCSQHKALVFCYFPRDKWGVGGLIANRRFGRLSIVLRSLGTQLATNGT